MLVLALSYYYHRGCDAKGYSNTSSPIEDDGGTTHHSIEIVDYEEKEYIRDETKQIEVPTTYTKFRRRAKTCARGERLLEFTLTTDNYG